MGHEDFTRGFQKIWGTNNDYSILEVSIGLPWFGELPYVEFDALIFRAVQTAGAPTASFLPHSGFRVLNTPSFLQNRTLNRKYRPNSPAPKLSASQPEA